MLTAVKTELASSLDSFLLSIKPANNDTIVLAGKNTNECADLGRMKRPSGI